MRIVLNKYISSARVDLNSKKKVRIKGQFKSEC